MILNGRPGPIHVKRQPCREAGVPLPPQNAKRPDPRNRRPVPPLLVNEKLGSANMEIVIYVKKHYKLNKIKIT